MSKDNHLELEGIVTYAGRGIFRVAITNSEDHIVKATICGKMRKYKINLYIGDQVMVKVSPYDMNTGIIFQRIK